MASGQKRSAEELPEGAPSAKRLKVNVTGKYRKDPLEDLAQKAEKLGFTIAERAFIFEVTGTFNSMDSAVERISKMQNLGFDCHCDFLGTCEESAPVPVPVVAPPPPAIPPMVVAPAPAAKLPIVGVLTASHTRWVTVKLSTGMGRVSCNPIHADSVDYVMKHLPEPKAPRPLCPVVDCGKTFKTNAKLATHFRDEHGFDHGFECKFCGRLFKSLRAIMKHGPICKKPDGHQPPRAEFCCDKCNVAIRFPEQSRRLSYHTRAKHTDAPVAPAPKHSDSDSESYESDGEKASSTKS